MVAPLLLMAVLAVPASAQTLPDCIHVSSTSIRFKKTLDAVRECQDAARQKLIEDAKDKGKPLSYQKIELIEDRQRAEVRTYLEKSGTIIEGSSKSARSLEEATAKNPDRLSTDESAEISALETRLRSAAGDGKAGITPAMGRDIIDSLEKKQGSVSPGMRDLIDSVVRDGGKLTPETMKKLQGAGRAAKGAALDLNIDKGMEKEILERDFDADKESFQKAQSAPGNL